MTYRDRRPLETDLKNLAAACAAAQPVEAFMNAASPGVLTKFVPDRYYKNEDAYVEALAECAEGGIRGDPQGRASSCRSTRPISARPGTTSTSICRTPNSCASPSATSPRSTTRPRNIPPEPMRMHICWGNYEGPHTHDIPLAKMFDVCMQARPQALSIRGRQSAPRA